MKYVRGWRWEHVWVGQALTSNVIFPLFTLALVWPPLRTYMAGVPAGRYATLFLMGMTWGLGGIGYGMSLVLLGLSFTYSVLFSITTVCGALLPIWMGLGTRPPQVLTFCIGLALCVAGMIVVAHAAARREQEASTTAAHSDWLAMPVAGLSYTTSLLLVLVAGIFSASMGLALAKGEDLVDGLLKGGVSPVVAPLVVWVPVYLGSASVAVSYGFYCALRSRSLRDFFGPHAVRNWTLVHTMGILGFGAVLLYGLGASVQGHPPKNVAWAVYMASFVLSGNSIGLATREWKDCSHRTHLDLFAGILLLLCAIAFLANA
jgi:L-rhamnose-H+ transport protein